MSPRRARYLVSLDRRLRDLPLLADAYRRGLVSWCQARLLVRVIAPSTQSRWIRYAREVTVRRLEDVVVASEVAAAEAPAHIGASGRGTAAHGDASAHAGASAYAGAPPLPPTEPTSGRAVVDPTTAPAGPDFARLHTSAPPTPDTRGRHTSALLEDATTEPFVPTAGGASAPLDSSLAPPHGRSDRRIVFWAPLGVAALWDSALRACRAAAGRHLDDWECFLVFVQALRDTWENPDDPHWKRRYRIFERDGWRCMAPGCTSRSGLNEHHVVFRSQRGGDDEGNLVTLCIGHHQQGVHEGRIACFGRAPDALWWDLGLRPDGPPLIRYFGERVVRRRPFAHDPSDVAPATPAPMGRAG